MAREQRSKPERELRITKKVRVSRWIKPKPEEADEGKLTRKPRKVLQESVVEKHGVLTRCCTRCGFSDLDCAC